MLDQIGLTNASMGYVVLTHLGKPHPRQPMHAIIR